MEDKKIKAHDIMNDARRNMIDGKMDDAIANIEKATKLYEEIYKDDKATLAEYYSKFANILYMKLESIDKAIDYYVKSSNTYLELGDNNNYALINYTIAEIYDVELDNLTASAEHLNNALSTYIDIDSDKQTECLEKLANIYYRLDEYDIVSDALNKATDRCMKSFGISQRTADCMHNAGKICFDMRHLDESMQYLEKAKNIYMTLEGEDGYNLKSVSEEYKIVRAYKGCELN